VPAKKKLTPEEWRREAGTHILDALTRVFNKWQRLYEIAPPEIAREMAARAYSQDEDGEPLDWTVDEIFGLAEKWTAREPLDKRDSGGAR